MVGEIQKLDCGTRKTGSGACCKFEEDRWGGLETKLAAANLEAFGAKTASNNSVGGQKGAICRLKRVDGGEAMPALTDCLAPSPTPIRMEQGGHLSPSEAAAALRHPTQPEALRGSPGQQQQQHRLPAPDDWLGQEALGEKP